MHYVHSSEARRSSPIILVGILMALAGNAVPALAVTYIAGCPFLIDTPGNYAINSDLTSAGPDCIRIAASNVTLALNGFTIFGQGTGNGISVIPTSGRLNHVGIQGPGRIQRFAIGIQISNADYSQVSLLSIKSSTNFGLYATNATYLTAGSNVIGRSVNTGVLLLNTSSSSVAYNDLSGNGGHGLGMSGGGGNTVNNNTMNGNDADGMFIQSPGTRVYGNVTNANLTWGIAVVVPGNQVFSNTSSRSNGDVDMYDPSPTCSGNTWSDNVFGTQVATCIH